MASPTATNAVPQLPVTAAIGPTLKATVSADESWIKTEETKVQTWLKVHERILIIAILALSSVFCVDKFLNVTAARDKAAANQAAQVLTQQQTVNQQLAAQIAIAQKSNQDLLVQLSQQNAVLQTQQSQRTIVLQQQVQADKTLPMPDLGNRWAKLAQLDPADIQATTAGITVTPQGALDTTTALEQVPVLKSNLADETTQAANLSTELDSTKSLNGNLITQVAGLNTQLVDKDKSCKADIVSATAQARKGKLKAFGIGYVLGFISGVFVAK
jgi:hypothetical protein